MKHRDLSRWWVVKLGAAVALLTWFVLASLGLSQAGPAGPWLLGEWIVGLGVGIHVGHYWLLKRVAPRLDQPARLVCGGGLFAVIRHPMYLGDAIWYTGLALLAVSPVAIALLLLGWIGIIQQARHEDQFLAERFGDDFEQWRGRTRLLLPLPRLRQTPLPLFVCLLVAASTCGRSLGGTASSEYSKLPPAEVFPWGGLSEPVPATGSHAFPPKVTWSSRSR
jgi:protein-S-isoprenylcysteine O-methyltransferase Ste14